MAASSTAATATTPTRARTPSRTYQQQRAKTLSRVSARKAGIGAIGTTSTPNLNQIYSAFNFNSSSSSNRLAPGAAGHGPLARKASHVALTPGSLATIPDDTENYPFLNFPYDGDNSPIMAPMTPGRSVAGSVAGDDFNVGDLVDVPGNMYGTIRFVGTVAGRKGTFAGVELPSDFAERGKNNGDVDG